MPKQIAPLSELQVRKAKAAEQPYRLADGKGLYLQVMPNGSRYWRMKYRFDGKEKLASFGVYPEVSLADARKACLAARQLLKAGTDPSEQKKEVKRARALEAVSSFEAVAREWFESQKAGWTEVYAGKVINSLEVDAFPKIGAKPIGDIEAPHMLEIVRAIEARGVRETAKRVLQRSRAVFQYGIMTGRCSRNPAADIDAETVLKKGAGVKHMARVKPVEIPQLMRDIAAYQGDIITRLALRLMAFTFVRTTELIQAEWVEFDEKAAEWRIPAERMKMRDPHIVPLSRQALEVLEELRKLNGAEQHVFYSVQGRRPISNNTMLYALYRMGYKSRMTGHGFRGLAATVLRELGYSRDLVDRQLAHAERNQVTAAYVHAEFLPERRKMMQHWADYLDAAVEAKPRLVFPAA
ncbi:Prophage integrase IntS [Paraburkholderia aspalathi]|uniref:Prophage integrase IntS n=1 Tax=Paraburkholderia aspalathi TaxID=1324617 RepID=A0ABM8SI18_9BURK|nr:integrase arm-type DNA-binding domain-containing protein [Paraburkholderia aspalathi]MBK3821804.1 tyrosine-type recombinase/integrase [Paraburkholderia aspalathi]MBK3833592.1 tyrosine-type recombinase/integrase [Paraburkholderia aspalathi]MBK3863315.1 tyrosine-type recombinase/integrase [Paraburkholderia aspalathi]CAE6811564.1 Prophage integrase IntS [Paraburkholderia aspalathi]